MEVLSLKMKKDLLNMSLEYTEGLKYTEGLDIDKDEFTNWITHKIDYYIDKEKISFSKDKGSEDKCTARLWNGGQGEKQCTHKTTEKYCEKHKKMLNEEGVLRFGDIRDDRPSHDLIKKKNNIIEKLHWIDSDPLNQIQYVLNCHRKKVICCVPKLIVN